MALLQALTIHVSSERTVVRAIAVAVFIALTGCASGDSIVKVYENAEFDGGPFNNVLVVGVHTDVRTRRLFENALAATISDTGSEATTSLSVMEAATTIDRDAVIAAVRRSNADAVLITRLLDVEMSASIREGRTAAVAQRRNDVPLADFFRYDYVEYQDPMTFSSVRTVVLASDLYNVRDEERIWSIESSSFEKETTDEILDSATDAISTQLRRDGLIE